MAPGRSTTAEATDRADEATTEQVPVETGFGAEFRELARQRRFVRSESEPDWREQAAPASKSRRRASAPAPAAPAPARAATPAPAPTADRAAAPGARTTDRPVAPRPRASAQPIAAQPLPRAATRTDARLSDDHRATVRELARLSDRLVESREALATVTVRAEALETELAGARTQLAAADERLLASRVLVQDAQRATHELAERCAALESRCDTLQDALELAVNASWITRWKWRRAQRAAH